MFRVGWFGSGGGALGGAIGPELCLGNDGGL